MKKFISIIVLLVAGLSATIANAGIPLSSNFEPTIQLPLDSREVVTNVSQRNAIPSSKRYQGLTVFVTATSENWQLQGGITNSNWVLIGKGVPAPPLYGVQYNNPLGTFDADVDFTRDPSLGTFRVAGVLDGTKPNDVSEIGIGTISLLGQNADGAYFYYTGASTGTDVVQFSGYTDIIPGIATIKGVFNQAGNYSSFSGNIDVGVGAISLMDASDATNSSALQVLPPAIILDSLNLSMGDDSSVNNLTTITLNDNIQRIELQGQKIRIGDPSGILDGTQIYVDSQNAGISFTYNTDFYTFPSNSGNPGDVLTQSATPNILEWSPSGGGVSSLTSTYVGYGSGTNQLTGTDNFTWINADNQLKIGTLAGGGLISGKEATGNNVQGGNITIETGPSTGGANSATLTLSVSDVDPAPGSTPQIPLPVFYAHASSSDGAFTSWGDPFTQNGGTKYYVNDPSKEIGLTTDGDFIISNVAGERWFILDPDQDSLTIGKIDHGATNYLTMQNDVIDFYNSQFNVHAGPSPTGGKVIEAAHDGTDAYVILGDVSGTGNFGRLYVTSFEQKAHLIDLYLQEGRSTDVASASEVDLGVVTGNFVHITGTTNIDRMNTPTNFLLSEYGARLIVEFDGNLTLTHGASSGTLGFVPFLLAGSTNFAVTAGTRMEFIYDNTFWKEISRTVP